jgi:transglutaminase-like putative cysteine protease
MSRTPRQAHLAKAISQWPMIRIAISIQLSYDIDALDSDFIFNIHAAMTPQQNLISEQISVSQDVAIAMHADPLNHNRVMRFSANAGALQVNYQATVDLQHHTASADQVQEMGVANLPWHVLPYLYPSRYCQSDQLHDIANQAFGSLSHGYLRVQAIRDWVLSRVTFHSNTSNEHTTALDTLRSGVGVCRDFSHLMIALCRALSIPARFVTGIDYGSDPALGPTDFHAYVEVYLDSRWYIFDASGVAVPMGLLRLSTDRDASDTAIATIFGSVRGSAPIISVQAVADALGVLEIPQHVAYAISTDV